MITDQIQFVLYESLFSSGVYSWIYEDKVWNFPSFEGILGLNLPLETNETLVILVLHQVTEVLKAVSLQVTPVKVWKGTDEF